MNCKFCNEPLNEKQIKKGGKFCNRKCYWQWMIGKPTTHPFKKGHIPWIKGKKHTKETKEKMRKAKLGKYMEENHPRWKGNQVGYIALHCWVRRHKGEPKICEHCGVTCKERKLNWANIDHKYRRVLDDFISLCNSCHRKYDYKHNLKPNNKIGNNQFKTIS